MSYNGWKNYATWNVALWIYNDEGLYNMAREAGDYQRFRESLREVAEGAIAFETPDNVAWNDTSIDVAAIDRMLSEL